jgi:PAS domain S-box-containing protein
MEQVSGITAAEVIGRHPSELFPFVQASGLTERLEKVVAGEVPVSMDIKYSVPKTGKSGWGSDLSVPLRNSKGEIIGVIAMIREITWRKRMEDELRQALDATNSANSTMNRLMQVVAHEFRTPLGLLTFSTDILDRCWDRLTPEKRFEQNGHIRSAAGQLAILVNSVIAFNQLGESRSMKPPLLQDIGGLCRTISTEVEKVWGEEHEYNVKIDADCGAALLDEVQFRRVLENLLTNAFRYTPKDGTVSLGVRREENRLCLEISDTGIGIPEEDQALIFDAFYRSRNIEGRRGLGLGLSIVHEELLQMGGTIKVTSKIGDGTTMLVEIPVKDNPQ